MKQPARQSKNTKLYHSFKSSKNIFSVIITYRFCSFDLNCFPRTVEQEKAKMIAEIKARKAVYVVAREKATGKMVATGSTHCEVQ